MCCLPPKTCAARSGSSTVHTYVLSWGPQQLPLGSSPTSRPPSTLPSLLHLKPCSRHFCVKSIHSPELLGSSSSPVYPQCPYDLALTLSGFIACSSFTRRLSSTCSEALWLFNIRAVSCLWPCHMLRSFSGMFSHNTVLDSCEPCPT